MDRSEGERRGAQRPADQPETEGSRPSRSRRSVTGSAEASGAGRHFSRSGSLATRPRGSQSVTKGGINMPSNWLYIDTNFPSFTGEESLGDRVTTIQNYLYMLVEQLRYTLHNLDASNMNPAAAERYGISITQPLAVRLEDTEGRVAELSLTAQGLESQVSGLSGEVSAIAQYAGSITLSVTNGETASVIALKAGETVIASESIHMSGMVTFDGLSGGTTTIDGACIKTGTVSASRLDLTGAITFADLSDEVRNDIDDSWSMAADAQEAAGNAADAVGRWTYTGSTYIDGAMIMTGTVIASNLLGGTVGLLAAGGQVVGGIDIAYTTTGYGVELYTNQGGIRINSDGNIWMEANGGGETLGLADGYISCGADTMPRYDDQLSLGRSGYRWSQLYAASSSIVTSDRKAKEDINYDLSAYDALFDGLRPCSYRYRGGTSGRTHTGMIAQDVEELLEGLGMESGSFAGFVKSPGAEAGGFDYALRYEEFIALCIRQIQGLKSRVAALERSA